jgi:hypothetical protein
MLSAQLLRVGSEVLHSVMGGMALFCLFYAGRVPDPQMVRYLLYGALKFGVPALIILFCKIKYLERPTR